MPNPWVSGGNWSPTTAGGTSTRMDYKVPQFGAAADPFTLALMQQVTQPQPTSPPQPFAARYAAAQQNYNKNERVRRADPKTSVAAALHAGGLSPVVVAGFMGNFDVEGGFGGAQGDGGSASGIAQWRKDRRDNFRQQFGADPHQASPEDQAKFVLWELQNPEKAGMTKQQRDAIVSAKDPGQAAALIDQFYERSSGAARQQRVAAATGYLGKAQELLGAGGADLATGFDPSGYAAQQAAIRGAGQMAMQPFSISTPRPPMPEMPDAPDLPSRDFTEQDQIMASLAPKAFDATGDEAHGLQRRRLLQGMAQGLAGLPENAGVGHILAQVGAGLLGGRLSADDEIQHKVDEYDKKMEEYKKAQFAYGGVKAEAKFAEATNEAQLGFNLALKKADRAYEQWGKDWSSKVEGNMLVTTGVDKETGNLITSGTPIASLTLPQFKMREAAAIGHATDAKNTVTTHNAALVNAGIVSTATAMMQGDIAQKMAGGGDPASAGNMAAAVYASAAVDNGIVDQLVPPEAYKAAMESATAYATSLGLMQGSKEFAEAVKENITGNLIVEFQTNPALRKRMQELAPALSGLARANDRRVTRRKAGSTTTTDTEMP